MFVGSSLPPAPGADRRRASLLSTPAASRSAGPTVSREGCPITTADSNELRINDRIRAREVRLVSAEGEQIGIRPLPDALAMARNLDLDLVEIAPQAVPPVCKIMDYGKYKYEAAQKAKESRRKTSQISIKEMKYRVKIGKGDFDTKTSKVEHFLEEGHKVKITIMFRGREVHHPELGMRILDRVAEHNGHLAKVEASPKLDGRNMTMVLAPDKRVQAAAEAARKKLAAEQRNAERNGSSPSANGSAAGETAPGHAADDAKES
ncbi:MAG TPA: translation initiation factor IF-3 [Acidimicrobiales bacterium]|nr:translation initiation factor IF-3 [Acidimicrobiales bacterium]